MLVPTIGIEVHVELKSNSKVFSRSKNNFSDPINTNVSVLDLAYPGTLPRLNHEVINMALKACLALNCKINQTMHFDRKNYFYPDLPKGFQITQKDTPIGYDGYLEINTKNGPKKIEIERIHIEEDTCKSIHSGDLTLLNYNRAGVPLIEIVSKPVISDGEEACLYLEALRETLLYLGVSDVKMEEGSMRCDANISLKEENATKFGTKTEIKNIGSISKVAISINYEIERQKAILEAGGTIQEETRRFDDKTNTTILMRVKETGNDYRYAPEPDIPFVVISDEWMNEAKNSIGVMPETMRSEYAGYGISTNNIKTLVAFKDLNDYYRSIYNKTDKVILANLLTGDILSHLNKNNIALKDTKLTDDNLISLVNMLASKKISSKQGKEILPYILESDLSFTEIIDKLGIKEVDNSALETIVTKILDENEQSVNDYRAGKDKALKYLMGQIMKETKGQANPEVVNRMLIDRLQILNKD